MLEIKHSGGIYGSVTVTWIGPGHLEATDNLLPGGRWFFVSDTSPYTAPVGPGGLVIFRIVCP